MQLTRKIRVFISYSSHDEDIVFNFEKNWLELFVRQGEIQLWRDSKILPGQEWDREIRSNLETSEIILLFVSATFLSSMYIHEVELREAFRRHERGESVVIPIILSPCAWKDFPDIRKLQALPDRATPVNDRSWSKDQAFQMIYDGIKKAIKKHRESFIHRKSQSEATKNNNLSESSGSELDFAKINYFFTRQFISQNSSDTAELVVNVGAEIDQGQLIVSAATHICLLLDVSGSMNMPGKYDYLLRAVPNVINGLGENDHLSIILFSSQSIPVWSQNAVTSRLRRDDIVRSIDQSGVKFGGTNMAPGLRLALDELNHYQILHPNSVQRLYLMTDGQLSDSYECIQLNSSLRSSNAEINAVGFGSDFTETHFREILSGIPGGGISWVNSLEKLIRMFEGIGNKAASVVASEAKLKIMFTPEVDLKHAFRFRPGRANIEEFRAGKWEIQIPLGALELDSSCSFAFSFKLPPGKTDRQQVGTAELSYNYDERPFVKQQDIVINRTESEWRQKQTNEEANCIFRALDALNNDDIATLRKSFEGRLMLIRDMGGDIDQAKLLEKALAAIADSGSLKNLSMHELCRLNIDDAFI